MTDQRESIKIAVFIDGTGNRGEPGGSTNTNVYKMSEMLEPYLQQWLYVPGIGTEDSASRNFFSRMGTAAQNLFDQAFGRGATTRLKTTYKFIAETYQVGDQLFLFGFSRGALIARVLSGFIKKVGILFTNAAVAHYVEFAFYLYWKDLDGGRFDRFLRRMETRAGTNASEGISTHFLGQWDTVEALFVPLIGPDTEAELRHVARRESASPLPDWITHARHALAVHDLRSNFAPLLWSGATDPKTQSLKQLWFAGAHSDVGGGYADTPSPGTKFSDEALLWMRTEADASGLKFTHWLPTPTFTSDFTPHITTPAHEVIGPAIVRKALYDVEEGGQRSQHLHPSALKRLFAPVSSLYNTLDLDVRDMWGEADLAVMQMHYNFYYPTVEHQLALSPTKLQEDRAYLAEFIDGIKVGTLEDVTRILRLIVAFDIDFLNRELPQSCPPILPIAFTTQRALLNRNCSMWI